MLVHEHEVLRELSDSHTVARFIEMGRGRCHYIVMTLLGENISERRATADKRFSATTVALLSLQMIDAIEHMHNAGYIHRDIKPSNFCVGFGEAQPRCYIVDFGLARRWRLPSGEVRPPRESVDFRGTCRYASKHSHLGEELGRRDDLWSLLYMLLELLGGELPWHALKERDTVLRMKQAHEVEMAAASEASYVLSSVRMPGGLVSMIAHLRDLGYADAPDYEKLRGIFRAMLPPAERPAAGAVAEVDWAAEGLARGGKKTRWRDKGRGGAGGPPRRPSPRPTPSTRRWSPPPPPPAPPRRGRSRRSA